MQVNSLQRPALSATNGVIDPPGTELRDQILVARKAPATRERRNHAALLDARDLVVLGDRFIPALVVVLRALGKVGALDRGLREARAHHHSGTRRPQRMQLDVPDA